MFFGNVKKKVPNPIYRGFEVRKGDEFQCIKNHHTCAFDIKTHCDNA
jgi:hypothetical protein